MSTRIRKDGQITLSLAASNGREEVVRLLRLYAYVNNEHRTHSAVKARKIRLIKAKDDTKNLFSLLRRDKEGSSGSKSLSVEEKREFLHKRSLSLSILPQVKAAQSMNLGIDNSRRTSNLLDQNNDLAKESGRRNSLLKTASLPL